MSELRQRWEQEELEYSTKLVKAEAESRRLLVECKAKAQELDSRTASMTARMGREEEPSSLQLKIHSLTASLADSAIAAAAAEQR